MNKRKIELTINGTDVAFDVDLASHNAFVNGFTQTNKVQPSHNFVMQTASDESKEFLRKMLTGDGGGFIAVQIANNIDAEYGPKVNIAVKKPKNMPIALPETG